VDVARGILAVAVEAKVKTDPGLVAFYSTHDYRLLGTAPVGALPDMVTFTPDGRRVLVANEGEPSAYEVVDGVLPIDPEGSVSIIDIGRGCARPHVRTAHFRRFNGRRDALVKAGVRLFGKNATVAQDLEPEYIAVSGDEAFVTLQENNALAIVDVDQARVKSIVPLGTKDHSKAGNGLDASDRDLKINIASWPVKGMYQPDGIAAYRFWGRTFLVTANEGDARDYDGLAEEARVGSSSYELDATAFPNATDLKKNEALGRLTVTNQTGDTDGDGDFDEIHAFGARSFSIWDAATGRLVHDSGQDLEEINAVSELDAVFRLTQRVDALHAGEALEVAVRRADRGAEPERDGGQVRVGGEVSRRAGVPEELAEDRPVTLAGAHRPDVRLREPLLDERHRPLGRQRLLEDPGTRGEAQEREDHDPGEADRRRSGERALQPSARGAVMGRIGVDGVDQDVGVDEYHLRISSLRAIASSSSASASRNALSRSTPGATPPRETGVRR
jgi:hypothetical protein